MRIRQRTIARAHKAVVALLAISALLPAAINAHATGNKNVVLIYMDDSSYYSHAFDPLLKTPASDQLEKTGVNFTRALSPASVCSPSRGSILTGMLPQTNGLYRLVADSGLDFPGVAIKPEHPPKIAIGIHDDIPTLIEILHDKDYFTAITQKTHVQPIWKFPFSKGYYYFDKPENFSTLVDQVVEESAGKPFFLEANISTPHRPFELHLGNNQLLAADGTAIGIDPAKIEMPPWLPDTPRMRLDLAKYYGCVEIAENCALAVLDGLKKHDLLDNTLIIFSSDNGMGYHRAKVSAYAAGLHMPLWISGPGVSGGRTTNAPVSQIDLMPTILDYLGLPIPATVQGRSLWPILSGKEEAFPDRPTVMGTINEQYVGRAVCGKRFYYIRNISKPHGTLENPPMNADLFLPGGLWNNDSFGATLAAKDSHPKQYKILLDYIGGNLPDEELYDLDDDPWCMKNLAGNPDDKSELSEMRTEMAAWRSLSKDVDDPNTQIKRRGE